MERLWLQIVETPGSSYKPLADSCVSTMLWCPRVLEGSLEGLSCPCSSLWMIIPFPIWVFLLPFLLVEEALRLLPDTSSDWPCLGQGFVPAGSPVAKQVGSCVENRMTPTRNV